MSSPAPLKPHDVVEGMLVLVTGSNPEERGTVVKKQGMRVSVEVVTVANGETRKQKSAEAVVHMLRVVCTGSSSTSIGSYSRSVTGSGSVGLGGGHQ